LSVISLDVTGEERAIAWARGMRRPTRNFPRVRAGASVAFLSDLPVAAGMSNSSALLVAIFWAPAAVNGLEEWRSSSRTPEELTGYPTMVESGQDFGALTGDLGVGTHGGCEYHTTMLCARQKPRPASFWSGCARAAWTALRTTG